MFGPAAMPPLGHLLSAIVSSHAASLDDVAVLALLLLWHRALGPRSHLHPHFQVKMLDI